MTTLAVGEQGFIPDSGGNEQRTLRQAAAAAGVQTGNPLAGGTASIDPVSVGIPHHAMTMADPEGGGGIGAGIGNINTLAVGEQGGSILNPGGGGGNFGPPNMATLAIPENGGSIGPVTMAVGEDGGGFIGGPVTRALGETGGNMGKPAVKIPTLPPAAMTMAFPESGGGIGGGMMPTFGPANSEMGRPPMSITQAVSEDGRPPMPSITQVVGEQGAIGSPSIPGQNPFDFSTFKTDLLTGIGDLFKKYFDETSSPFGGNEITPPPAPGETKPTMSPGDLVAPSSNYGSLASKGMQSPFRGL